MAVAQTKTLAESAKKLQSSAGHMEDSADRRTELAADRTIFAAERTYGAWVRTGLLALASGMGAKAALAGIIPEWMILLNGSVLVLFSAFCFGAAVWRQSVQFATASRGMARRARCPQLRPGGTPAAPSPADSGACSRSCLSR